MDVLAEWFAVVIRDGVTDNDRSDRGELPSESFNGAKQHRADQNDRHQDVVSLHWTGSADEISVMDRRY